MATYVKEEGGKDMRVWGTYEPSQTESISKNVTIQHWDFPGDTIPVQLMDAGYSVINSEQTFLYLDGKTSDGGQVPQALPEASREGPQMGQPLPPHVALQQVQGREGGAGFWWRDRVGEHVHRRHLAQVLDQHLRADDVPPVDPKGLGDRAG